MMRKLSLMYVLLLFASGAWACSPVWIVDRYSVEDGHVYYIEGQPETKRLIEQADAGSFAFNLEKYQRSQFHAEDANHVFYKGAVLEGLDPAKIKYVYVGYLADDQYVFFNGKLIEGADGASFLGMPIHGRDARDHYFHGDGQRVYGDGEVLPGDAKTAYALEGGYYLDADHVYYMGEVLEGALPTGVERHGLFILSNGRVFRQGQRIDINADGFKVLEDVYEKFYNTCTGSAYLGSVLRNKDGVYALTADGEMVAFRWCLPEKSARRFLEKREERF